MTTFKVPEVNQGDQLPEMAITVTEKMIIMGAVTSRDWQPIHHSPKWAVEKAGLPDIIMNNYTQAGWISRFITDWCGPHGRLGRLSFNMRRPICPNDIAVFKGLITSVTDTGEVRWVDIEIRIDVGEQTHTTGSVRVALPATMDAPSPWLLQGDAWRP